MKFLFVIQGEGRGHLTQALSLAQIIEKNDHYLVGVCVGKSKKRSLPAFFTKKINAPVHLFKSPNFVTDKNFKGVNLFKTIAYNLLKFPVFIKSILSIRREVEKNKPDVIINFYEVLGGVYNLIFQPKCAFWVIGHQYLIQHPEFEFPKGKRINKFFFQLNTSITALGANVKIALSFQAFDSANNGTLQVFPPLLRKEVREVTPKKEDFYLVYMVNPGYAEEIIRYAKTNSAVNIQAFWDKKDAPMRYQPLKNLVFHQLNDTLYINKMANCKALITTAGFESVCEATYLGKPVMVVPVKGHYEQLCNALDTERAGVGIASHYYDFSTMQNLIPSHSLQLNSKIFWISSFEDHFLNLIREEFLVSENKVNLIDLSDC